MKDWPGQVVLCTSQIYWTLEVHEAIQAGPNVGFFTITSFKKMFRIDFSVDIDNASLSRRVFFTFKDVTQTHV